MARVGFPTKVSLLLTQWWGFCGQMILRPMLAVAQLLAVPCADRSKTMTHIKKDTLILQAGSWT